MSKLYISPDLQRDFADAETTTTIYSRMRDLRLHLQLIDMVMGRLFRAGEDREALSLHRQLGSVRRDVVDALEFYAQLVARPEWPDWDAAALAETRKEFADRENTLDSHIGFLATLMKRYYRWVATK